MLVVIIIGIIAAIAVPRMAGKTEQARAVAAQQTIGTLSVALDQFELHAGRFPTSEEGLQALVTRPVALGEDAGWDGPYLRQLPADPWGRAYVYKYPGEKSMDFDLVCLGRDGEEGTGDDILNVRKDTAQ